MKEGRKQTLKKNLFIAIAGIAGLLIGAFIQLKIDKKSYDECHKQLLDATAGLLIYKLGYDAAIKVVAEDVQYYPQYCERQSVYDAAEATKKVEEYEKKEHRITL